MEELPSHLLTLALGSYAIGCLAALVCWSNDKLANLFAFGSSTLAGLGGVCASVALLAGGATGREHPWEFLNSGIPYLKFSVRLDPLSAFFVLIVSLLALALSIYSFGYARSFYGRKNAGVLYFVMSHIGTGCIILGFLLFFQASGNYDFDGFRAVGSRMSPGARNAAFLLFLFGFGVKAGIVPLHIWLPAAHPVAPSNVSALMSGVLIKTGIYGLTRVLFDFLGNPPNWWGVTVLAF